MKRYHIVEPIGSGGMAVVYRAFDRLTGNTVALKRIAGVDSTDAAHRELFSKETFLYTLGDEFNILAGLRHPNIITVLDYGLDDDHLPFFTMELLEAPDIITEAGRDQPFTTRIDLLIQLLQALVYLHRRRILHRDLKPNNVLVADGVVRVLDFGLASPEGFTRETVGTYAYMAPETLQDSIYSPASDLYAVGVIAYELFTGELPFQVGDALAILMRPPDLTAIQPEALRSVIQTLLSKEPSARYPKAEAVIAALSALVGKTITEQPLIRESYLIAAPFIGRTHEIAHLTAALTAAVQGVGSATLIGGESGVGKSRLLNELRTRALTNGALVISGQAVAESPLPYHLWRAPLAYLALNVEIADFEAGVLLPVVPDIERLIGRTAPSVPPLTGDAGGQRLAQTILSLLERLQQPCLLLLEDLHWAGESLSLLQQVLWKVPSLPLLIVGTFRSDDLPTLPADVPEMAFLSLDRLSAPEIAQLATEMIGQNSQRPEVIDLLQRESDGNVFFLIETIRALAEHSGALGEIGVDTLPALISSGGIAQIIRHRLAYIPDWAQAPLKVAALIGRDIDHELIIELFDLSQGIDDWLYTCANAAVLENRENRWRFAHDKLREALLAEIAPAERVVLHRQIALALERLHAHDAAYAKRLSDHWYEAGDRERTLHYSLIAGEQSALRGTYHELRGIAERGLTMIQPTADPVMYARLLKLMGDATRYNEVETALAAYEQAFTLYEQGDNTRELAQVMLGMAIIYRDRGDRERAEALVERCIAYAQMVEDRRVLMTSLSAKARFVLARGDYEQASALYQQSCALAKSENNLMGMASYLMNLGAVACMQGRFDKGRAYFQDAEAIAQTVGATDTVVYSLLNQANIASDHNDYTAAEALFERCTPLIERLGDFTLLAGVYYDRGDNALRQGALNAAQKWYEQSRALAERLNNQRKWVDCLYGLGKVSTLRHQYDEARTLLTASLQRARAHEFIPEQIASAAYLVRVYLFLDDEPAARAILQEGLALALTLESEGQVLEMISAAVPYFLLHDQVDQAATLYGLATQQAIVSAGIAQLEADEYQQLEEELAPEALADAIERGKMLDLTETIADLIRHLTTDEG